MNNMLIIFPFMRDGTWCFDDQTFGLVAEPFVLGMSEIISRMLTRTDLPQPVERFKLIFSAQPFPGYQARIDHLREEMGGNWYRLADSQMEGWLCPAMFHYFQQAPPCIYAQAGPAL
jgi:hypothetical protein